MNKLSERKSLYNDILATGATKKSEGSSDFDKLGLVQIVNNPGEWSLGKSVLTNVFYSIACVFYGVIILAAIALFVAAIRKKQWLYLVHLPLLAAAFELIMWNKRAFLAWKDIDEYAVTLGIYVIVFAFLAAAMVKATGKISGKTGVISAVVGSAVFLVAYFAPLFIINIGMYGGRANSLALSVALLLLSIVVAATVIKTAVLVIGKKKKQNEETKN